MRFKSFVLVGLVACLSSGCATPSPFSPKSAPIPASPAKPRSASGVTAEEGENHLETSYAKQDEIPEQLKKDERGIKGNPYMVALLFNLPMRYYVDLDRDVSSGWLKQTPGLHETATIAIGLLQHQRYMVGAISGLTERQEACTRELSELRTELIGLKAQVRALQTQGSKEKPKSNEKSPASPKKKVGKVGPVEDPWGKSPASPKKKVGKVGPAEDPLL